MKSLLQVGLTNSVTRVYKCNIVIVEYRMTKENLVDVV